MNKSSNICSIIIVISLFNQKIDIFTYENVQFVNKNKNSNTKKPY